MELYLQFGYGMTALAVDLVREWGGGEVILSPRDLDAEALKKAGRKLRKADGAVLVDPQCFLRDADHYKLTAHDYWGVYKASSTLDLISGTGVQELVAAIRRLNQEVGAKRIILPGLLANPVSEDWFALHEQLVSAGSASLGGANLLATVALSADVVRSEDQVEAVVDRVAQWQCGGVYLVCEAPSSYLVEDPSWLANVLILTSGLRLADKVVIVGYCSHQMLSLAAAKVDAIASGTWRNVRAFPTAKFYNPDPDDKSRRATWYYCPQALSEYKLQFLDIAKRNGELQAMKPPEALGSKHADALFGGVDPSTVNWGQRNAFGHYLACLRGQCAGATGKSLADAVAKHEGLLSTAKGLIESLRKAGVYGQDREFRDFVDVNRAAMTTFLRARESRLSKKW